MGIAMHWLRGSAIFIGTLALIVCLLLPKRIKVNTADRIYDIYAVCCGILTHSRQRSTKDELRRFVRDLIDEVESSGSNLPVTLEAALKVVNERRQRINTDSSYKTPVIGVDGWGQELHYVVSDGRIMVWSYGINGVDDGGAGDDLVATGAVIGMTKQD